MFGEYGVYSDGKLFTLVCDNKLFVRKIETTELKNQPIRDQANELTPVIELPNEPDELLCVIEVKIKVKYDCFYNLLRNPHKGVPCSTYIDQCANTVTGWLKWRNKNRILIDIFTL